MCDKQRNSKNSMATGGVLAWKKLKLFLNYWIYRMKTFRILFDITYYTVCTLTVLSIIVLLFCRLYHFKIEGTFSKN